MKNFKTLLLFSFLLLGALSYLCATTGTSSLTSVSFENFKKSEETSSPISFKLRGNGIGLVEIGVGSGVGYGACCRGVSKESTVTFQGNVGDVVWDAKTKRILIELTASSNGKTYDLRRYY